MLDIHRIPQTYMFETIETSSLQILHTKLRKQISTQMNEHVAELGCRQSA